MITVGTWGECVFEFWFVFCDSGACFERLVCVLQFGCVFCDFGLCFVNLGVCFAKLVRVLNLGLCFEYWFVFWILVRVLNIGACLTLVGHRTLESVDGTTTREVLLWTTPKIRCEMQAVDLTQRKAGWRYLQDLGQVVQRVDSAIHRTNRYPVDKC